MILGNFGSYLYRSGGKLERPPIQSLRDFSGKAEVVLQRKSRLVHNFPDQWFIESMKYPKAILEFSKLAKLHFFFQNSGHIPKYIVFSFITVFLLEGFNH